MLIVSSFTINVENINEVDTIPVQITTCLIYDGLNVGGEWLDDYIGGNNFRK
jgi:hypothetical protein